MARSIGKLAILFRKDYFAAMSILFGDKYGIRLNSCDFTLYRYPTGGSSGYKKCDNDMPTGDEA